MLWSHFLKAVFYVAVFSVFSIILCYPSALIICLSWRHTEKMTILREFPVLYNIIVLVLVAAGDNDNLSLS